MEVLLLTNRKNKANGESGAEQHQDVKLMYQKRFQVTSIAMFMHDFISR